MKGILKTCPYESLREEIDRILGPNGLRVVEISVRRASKKVFADIFLARMSLGVAGSPDTTDLETASSVLHMFFEEYFKDQDFFLTLSSPGLGRSLKSLHEFVLFNGRTVAVSYLNDEGEVVSAVGRIEDANDDHIGLFLSGSGKIQIPVDSIKNACLEG